MITKKMRHALYERSDGKCEAMVRDNRGIWSRCWHVPVEIHHLVTRARGGHILDQAGEIHHLICLCPEHHRMSDGADAYDGGMLIDGYVTTSPSGRPVYQGSDMELMRKYGAK